MDEDTYTIKTGNLDVGDGHSIYYQHWGNKDAFPIFVLHGGPGSKMKNHRKNAFDPKKHNVIFHDQRGCGQSLSENPFSHNTIDKLADDIEKLREHFGYDRIHLFGHSWGSTLALFYAIKYPDSVKKMIIGGVYTATQAETDGLYQGDFKYLFPEAWQRFIEIVPEEKRNDNLSYYKDVFLHGTDAEKIRHLRHWSQLEPSPMSIDADYTKIRQEADSIDNLDDLQSVLIGIHYFSNGCFLPEGYILKHLKSIDHIQTVILQGRFDIVTPTKTAYDVAEQLGNNCHLHIVPSSHKGEGALREVQRAYAWSFLD